MNMYPNIFLYMKVSKSNGHTQFHISNLRYLKETWVQPTEPPACKWVSKGCRNSEPPPDGRPYSKHLRIATWGEQREKWNCSVPLYIQYQHHKNLTSLDITPPWAHGPPTSNVVTTCHDTATGMIWDANSSSTAAVKSARLKSWPSARSARSAMRKWSLP